MLLRGRPAASVSRSRLRLALRFSLGFPYALAVGAGLGLSLTWWTLSDGTGFGAVRSGPWTGWSAAAGQGTDRYALARLARTGDLPLGSGEGIAFTAMADTAGQALEGRCRYSVAPILPAARWWTLTLYGPDGTLPPNAAGRQGFTSLEVQRRGDGAARVAVGPQAAAGNWLPSPAGPFTLVLRLYDTPLAGTLGSSSEAVLPAITREGCP